MLNDELHRPRSWTGSRSSTISRCNMNRELEEAESKRQNDAHLGASRPRLLLMGVMDFGRMAERLKSNAQPL
jgi:hypothetical protein